MDVHVEPPHNLSSVRWVADCLCARTAELSSELCATELARFDEPYDPAVDDLAVSELDRAWRLLAGCQKVFLKLERAGVCHVATPAEPTARYRPLSFIVRDLRWVRREVQHLARQRVLDGSRLEVEPGRALRS